MIAGAYRLSPVMFRGRERIGFYRVERFGFMDYRAVDCRTEFAGTAWRSQREAIIDAHGLNIRNMQHS